MITLNWLHWISVIVSDGDVCNDWRTHLEGGAYGFATYLCWIVRILKGTN